MIVERITFMLNCGQPQVENKKKTSSNITVKFNSHTKNKTAVELELLDKAV